MRLAARAWAQRGRLTGGLGAIRDTDVRARFGGRGPPVSGAEGEREEVGTGDYQWAPDVRVLVFLGHKIEFRPLATANGGARRERHERTSSVGRRTTTRR